MESPEFSSRTRSETLSALRAAAEPVTFDAVVIGGGIVGTSVARELAIRGLKALVVEKGDFASGTSSRSSKLIHGGLRYLEMFDFHLVFEALAERHWLLKSQPHLVQPLEFNLPIYSKKDAPPGSRGGIELGMGLWLYDALSLFRTPFFHGKHSSDDLRGIFPGIRSRGLKGSYFYADAMMLDDELVLETIYDAFRRGAKALNYVRALGVGERDAAGLHTVTLEDERARTPGTFSVKAREVLVCVGPWTEQFGGRVAKGSGRQLKPSRGAHLIIDWKRLPIERCLVMYHPDGRIVFAIPRRDLGDGAEIVIVGTTDAPEHGDLDHVNASGDDVEYLLRVLAEYFPEARITKGDIVVSYAGVRPLLDFGAESEAQTSREHEIWRNEAGVVFMAGGKYTTFRRIAEELADFAFPRTRTSATVRESKASLSTPEEYAARMNGPKIWGRFSDDWVRWKLKHSMACTLEDVVFRRLPLWMGGRRAFESALPRVGDLTQSFLGWTAKELETEKSTAFSALEERLRWR